MNSKKVWLVVFFVAYMLVALLVVKPRGSTCVIFCPRPVPSSFTPVPAK